jgi:hypothetical protein
MKYNQKEEMIIITDRQTCFSAIKRKFNNELNKPQK